MLFHVEFKCNKKVVLHFVNGNALGEVEHAISKASKSALNGLYWCK